MGIASGINPDSDMHGLWRHSLFMTYLRWGVGKNNRLS